MKILVTGFDPFGGDKINPAYEAVKLLPDVIEGVEIIKLEIPTVFYDSAEVMKAKIIEVQPDVVLCVGQAGGRSSVSVEQVAINKIEARIPDNKGNQPFDTPVQATGETAYFTNLPIKAMVKNIHDNGLPAYISYTAGTYVCNYIMYELMYLIATEFNELKGGFIHVPFIPAQTIERPVDTAAMSLQDIALSLEYALAAIVTNKEDIQLNSGTTH